MLSDFPCPCERSSIIDGLGLCKICVTEIQSACYSFEGISNGCCVCGDKKYKSIDNLVLCEKCIAQKMTSEEIISKITKKLNDIYYLL